MNCTCKLNSISINCPAHGELMAFEEMTGIHFLGELKKAVDFAIDLENQGMMVNDPTAKPRHKDAIMTIGDFDIIYKR